MKMKKRTKRLMTAAGCMTLAAALSGCCMITGLRMKDLPPAPANMKNETETGTISLDTPYTEPKICMETEMCMEEREADRYLADAEEIPWPAGAHEPDWNTEEYKYVEENGWMSTAASPFSTFAADVDTASYANVRRMLLEGKTVPADAVRIEEMINYFHYDYPDASGSDAFSVTTQIAPCPWNEDTQLLLVGLKAGETSRTERAPSNIVFLIDVSGSMEESDKLPLVQRAFRLLIDELDAEDTVSIVTYANEDTIVLDGVSGEQKTILCDAMEDLNAYGGTNGSQGLVRAYELAQKHFIAGGNNRVILATDGDLNIGMTDEGSLTRLIRKKAKTGVYLSVLGFGRGNISDTNMEALADNGNGNYSYIDTIGEARRVLVDEAGGTLLTVAKDVKLQMEFNPAVVKGYRLIGYENRTMSAESFADDTKDGGEIGSGHTMTALYEIASVDSSFEIPAVVSKYAPDTGGTAEGSRNDTDGDAAREWGTLHIRYKEPDGETSNLMDTVIDGTSVADEMSDDLSWAAGVAQIGMLLKDSQYAGTTDLSEVRMRLKALTGDDLFREEFVYLMSRMEL